MEPLIVSHGPATLVEEASAGDVESLLIELTRIVRATRQYSRSAEVLIDAISAMETVPDEAST